MNHSRGNERDWKRTRDAYLAADTRLIRQPGSPSEDALRAWPETHDVAALCAQVDDLKQCLDSFRPLNQIQAKNLASAFEIEYTYDSNRIEGNTLTLQETAVVIERGITIGGKTIREHLEATNHQMAIDRIKAMADAKQAISEDSIKELHQIVLSGIHPDHAGHYRSVQVHITGSEHEPPSPYQVPRLMRECFAWYQEVQQREHPVLLAADLSERIVTIHPFIDGNGRTSRLSMNLALLQYGYPITTISSAQRAAYYDALQERQMGRSLDSFQRFVLGSVKTSLLRYVDAVARSTADEDVGKGFFERWVSEKPIA